MLTELERADLRKAICDVSFIRRINPVGRITPELLATIDGMSDEVVRGHLTIYHADKEADRLQRIAQLQSQLTALQNTTVLPEETIPTPEA